VCINSFKTRYSPTIQVITEEVRLVYIDATLEKPPVVNYLFADDRVERGKYFCSNIQASGHSLMIESSSAKKEELVFFDLLT
jgi:hypothetical protein